MNLISVGTKMVPVDSAPTVLLTGVTNALLLKGFSPYIGENGNWFVYDSNTMSFVDTGISPIIGYVPKRGVDYWTAADQQVINQYIDQQINAKFTEVQRDIENRLSHAILDSSYTKTT